MFELNRPYRSTSRRNRRQFIRAAGAMTLPFLFGGKLLAEVPDPDQLIVREQNPDNFEFPFHTLNSFLTPNDRFYVRNHFAAPTIKMADWSLEVVGAVENPLKLSYERLTSLPVTRMPMTLECAGNGRSHLVPKAGGVQWDLGAVSTAEWAGVTLAAVLKEAKIKRGAVEVILEGTDTAEPKNPPKPVGAIAFARSLPVGKALRPEVLLAYKMNGAALPNAHGFPLRAVVGGWYGMASVKWLRRIVVTEKPFHGYWQTTDYSVWEKRDGLPTQVPITEMQAKASIALPRAADVLPAGKPVRVYGAAWSGESKVAKVQISTDDGKTWAEAKLLGDPVPYCWRLWEHTWNAPAAGKYVLLARAIDERGRVQDESRDPDRRNYVISHSLRTEVTVK